MSPFGRGAAYEAAPSRVKGAARRCATASGRPLTREPLRPRCGQRCRAGMACPGQIAPRPATGRAPVPKWLVARIIASRVRSVGSHLKSPGWRTARPGGRTQAPPGERSPRLLARGTAVGLRSAVVGPD